MLGRDKHVFANHGQPSAAFIQCDSREVIGVGDKLSIVCEAIIRGGREIVDIDCAKDDGGAEANHCRQSRTGNFHKDMEFVIILNCKLKLKRVEV